MWYSIEKSKLHSTAIRLRLLQDRRLILFNLGTWGTEVPLDRQRCDDHALAAAAATYVVVEHVVPGGEAAGEVENGRPAHVLYCTAA